jgi:hypothetical protein
MMERPVEFLTEEHAARFTNAIKQIGQIALNEEPYGSAIYLLTVAPTVWNKAIRHITEERINFQAMIEEGYVSTGESIAIRTAGNLYNGCLEVNPVEFTRLDSKLFRGVINAIRLRRDELLLKEIKLLYEIYTRESEEAELDQRSSMGAYPEDTKFYYPRDE